MRITRRQLRQIIKEELSRTLNESPSASDQDVSIELPTSSAKRQTMSKKQWDSSMSKFETSERLRFLKAIIDSGKATAFGERSAYETEIGKICSKYSDLEGCPKK